jgi:hypothetical protein
MQTLKLEKYLKVSGKTSADAAWSASWQSAEGRVHELVRRQWTTVCMGRKEAPVAIAAFHRDGHWADVVILRGPDHAAAYRALVHPDNDPLAVTHVVWHYLAVAAQTLHAVLHLNPAATAVRPYPIPRDCQLPELALRPLVIRPGTPLLAETR